MKNYEDMFSDPYKEYNDLLKHIEDSVEFKIFLNKLQHLLIDSYTSGYMDASDPKDPQKIEANHDRKSLCYTMKLGKDGRPNWLPQKHRGERNQNDSQGIIPNKPDPLRQWYVYHRGEEIGPVPESKLVQAYSSGFLSPTSLLFTDCLDQWIKVDDVPMIERLCLALKP